jgi:hypothetical protein
MRIVGWLHLLVNHFVYIDPWQIVQWKSNNESDNVNVTLKVVENFSKNTAINLNIILLVDHRLSTIFVNVPLFCV